VQLYDLGDSVKTYGDPQELADNKEVELVVCSVRVDRHLPTISPALKAGKDVYVEWPLGKSAAEARELLALKSKYGVKHATVGLQARVSPIIKKLKDLVEEGSIGKVLSSTWLATGGQGGESMTETYEYLGQKHVGGNLVTIHFGHSVDFVQQVLGYGFKTHHAQLVNVRPEVKLLSSDGKLLKEKHAKTADDTIFFTGILESGVPLSMSLRGGEAFPNTPGLDWRIYGSTGEIRLTSTGPFLQIGYPNTKVEVYDNATKNVEEVTVDEGEFAQFPLHGRNVGRVYEAFAKGKEICTFEDAVQRHELLEKMYAENGYIEGS